MILEQVRSSEELRSFRRHDHLARQGDAPKAIYRLEDGWACRYRMLSSGRRQITALFLPGEYCEPQWLFEPRTSDPIVALTSLRVRRFDMAEFSAAAPGSRGYTKTLLAATLQTINRQAEWIATLGRKTALERVCALFHDIFQRMRDSGRAMDDRCAMPLTQADLADVVGLTPVHVNRVLKTLRAGGLVELDTKRLCITDPARVREIGSGGLSLERLGELG